MKNYLGLLRNSNNISLFIQQKALEDTNFINGGVDVARFELFVTKFLKHLFTPNIAKICSMIEKLGFVA